MTDKREVLRPVRVTKLCLVCGAPLAPTGVTYATMPPRCPHVCTADDTHPRLDFDKQYPAIEWETVE